MLRPILVATAVSGTLDILFAIALTLLFGREPVLMLRRIASALSPIAGEGPVGPVLGLMVHFTLMALMAAVFVLVARQRPVLLERPVVCGVIYGLITYVIMNLVVVPLRFPAAWAAVNRDSAVRSHCAGRPADRLHRGENPPGKTSSPPA
jgi:hypothetical protein